MVRFRAAVVFLAAAISPAAVGIETADCERDWSGVQLAWRGDPRAPADLPGGVERPMTRRQARRARRAAARGWSPPEQETARAEVGTVREWRTLPLSIAPPAPLPHEVGGAETREIVVGRTLIRDVPYGKEGHPRQRFNLFLPGEGSGTPYPLVVWIHGETWRDGSKEDCPLTWLTEEGYAVASIGYRLTDTAVFPAQLHDCIAALTHLQTNAPEWRIDPDRIALVGSSAGGHLAALMALDETDDETDPGDPGASGPVDVAGVCVVAAPTLLTALGPAHDRPASPASLLVGGPLPEFREAAQRASPLTHVSSDAPPFLIIHARGDERSAADRRVPLEQSRQFDSALRAVGADSSLVVLEKTPPAKALCDRSTGGRLLLEFLERSFDASRSRPGHADRAAGSE